MELDKFLNLLAAAFGIIGSVFVMQSIMTMPPDLMVRQVQTAWDYNVSLVETMASQRAENIVGFICIFLAFVFSAGAAVPNGNGKHSFKSKWFALTLAAVTVGAYLLLHFVKEGIFRDQRATMINALQRSQPADASLSRKVP